MKVFYISRGDVHALVGICEALPTMIDDPCQVELERAEVYRQLGDLDKSFLYLDKAVRCDPLNIVAIKSLGFCHKQQGEYDLALHWFLKWKELEPQSAEACYQTGMIYFRLKSPDLARNACSQALDIDPKHIMAKSLKDKLLGQ
jgi:tetratricopeptide (TPR) repeat protein